MHESSSFALLAANFSPCVFCLLPVACFWQPCEVQALFLFHAALSTVIGVATFFLPHHLASAMFGSEEHVTQVGAERMR